ncbi:MAG: YdeI/OmpD-associated family protein [Verrucomicrobiota bacterium]
MNEQPIISFDSSACFREWLARHHAGHPGIWIQIAKKASGIHSVTYAEAVEEALCHGWIDGQRKSFDATSFLQKFTPRGKRSIWSKVNVGHVTRLEKEGRMTPAGLAAAAAAKADGRWEAAYHSSRTAEMPGDFIAALDREPDARAFFETLNKTQRYPFFFRITTAKKAETRSRRIADFVSMLKRGETLR